MPAFVTDVFLLRNVRKIGRSIVSRVSVQVSHHQSGWTSSMPCRSYEMSNGEALVTDRNVLITFLVGPYS